MPHSTFDDIGSGNGLMPSDNKSFPEPLLTQIYIAIWHMIYAHASTEHFTI